MRRLVWRSDCQCPSLGSSSSAYLLTNTFRGSAGELQQDTHSHYACGGKPWATRFFLLLWQWVPWGLCFHDWTSSLAPHVPLGPFQHVTLHFLLCSYWLLSDLPEILNYYKIIMSWIGIVRRSEMCPQVCGSLSPSQFCSSHLLSRESLRYLAMVIISKFPLMALVWGCKE